MKKYIFFLFVIFVIISCHNRDNTINNGHSHHGTNSESHHDHGNIETFENHTAYSDKYEVYVEFSPLAIGEESNLAVHITDLSNHKPIQSGNIELKLDVFGQSSTTEFADKMSAHGIFSLNIKPRSTGIGKLTITLNKQGKKNVFKIKNITIHPNKEIAIHELEHKRVNDEGIDFSKEQAWQFDFKTEEIKPLPFYSIIKTSGEILSSQNDEIHLTAFSSGTFYYNNEIIQPGVYVNKNQVLGFISDESVYDENSYTKFTEAKARFEKAKADFERAEQLIQKKIISEEKFQEYKMVFETDKANYEILNSNFTKKGIVIKAKESGTIKAVYAVSGNYLNTGDKLFCIAQNQKLIVRADVSQNHYNELGNIKSINFKVPGNDKIYESDSFDGKIISFGKNRDQGYMIPFYIEISNPGEFYIGSYVETFLKGKQIENALTIPNTAIMEEQGSYFVFVQTSGERFEKRYIKFSHSDGIKSLITKGLNFGERVVTIGAVRVKLASASGTLPAHGHAH